MHGGQVGSFGKRVMEGQVGSFGKRETASGKQVSWKLRGNRKRVRLEASGKRGSGMDTSFVSCEFVLMFGGVFRLGLGLRLGLGFGVGVCFWVWVRVKIWIWVWIWVWVLVGFRLGLGLRFGLGLGLLLGLGSGWVGVWV